ncbi:MAG: DUF5005 domain-containing protein [Labilibaculum sp.]|nr:DUF5005 domain-containing protein [Labilibaculum sp.]
MKYSITLTGLLLLGLISCNNKTKDNSKSLEVYKDVVFTNLFHKDSNGVTGADGTISVPFPDGSSLFMMGDSFLGKVVNMQRDPKTKMINNTFIIVDKERLNAKALYGGKYNNPETFVIPENDDDCYYWPGHGFVHDGVFHFFMSKFKHSNDMWGFEFVGTDYLRYTVDGIEKIAIESFPFTVENKVHWGHCVLKDGNYIYIYGSRVEEDGIARAHVCRTILNLENKLDFEKIEFFDQNRWSNEARASTPMEGTSSNISEQFSVFKYQDKYILLSQERGIGEGAIYTYLSDSPIGPWKSKKMIYKTKEASVDPDIFTYNAMAHPQYIENDELLICYNINSLKVPRVYTNVDCYRPVFLRVPMALILGQKK